MRTRSAVMEVCSSKRASTASMMFFATSGARVISGSLNGKRRGAPRIQKRCRRSYDVEFDRAEFREVRRVLAGRSGMSGTERTSHQQMTRFHHIAEFDHPIHQPLQRFPLPAHQVAAARLMQRFAIAAQLHTNIVEIDVANRACP